MLSAADNQIVLDTVKMKAMRERLGLSMDDAAAACRFANRQQWWQIETGKRKNITLETLGRIAKTLKCQPKDLLKSI